MTDLLKNVEGFSDSRLNSICMELSYLDKKAKVQKDKKGKIIFDTTTKDTEIVKLSENVEEYFKREVYPHIPDAHYVYEYDPSKKNSKEKLGAEIPFTKYFYEYTELETSDKLMEEFKRLEESTKSLLRSL